MNPGSRQDVSNHQIQLAVWGEVGRSPERPLLDEIDNMALSGDDIQERDSEMQNVINLARVQNPHKGISHHDYMQVGCGKRAGELIQWLVRQSNDIMQSMVKLELLHFRKFAAASYETKYDFRMLG